ncbi:MAG TPA: alpha/beta fold hydrolase, partial [Stellaceae bacterium]|nr:alpha/beta fold hydrolase [Stellaceae bacterium]
MESKFAETAGAKLHYLEAGKGELVLLLHGYAQTSHMWRPLIPLLARTHRIVAPDLRGFGASSKPEQGYDKKTMAEDVHALAVSLGHRRARVVGHDIGLMVAYAYAA